MKKILILILFLLVTNNASSSNIVYLDVQFIIDNSELGKFYKSKIKKIQNDSNLKLKDDKRAFKEVNGQMKFTKRDLRVNRFSLLVDESDLQLNGSLSNVFKEGLISELDRKTNILSKKNINKLF